MQKGYTVYCGHVTSKGASASYSWHSYNFCDLWDVVCHQCVPFLPLLGHGDTLPEWGEVPAVCLSARQYLCERERKALLTIRTLVFLWDHSAPQPWYWVCLGTVWLYHGGICAMVKKQKKNWLRWAVYIINIPLHVIYTNKQRKDVEAVRGSSYSGDKSSWENHVYLFFHTQRKITKSWMSVYEEK